jgi:hypothetical protein
VVVVSSCFHIRLAERHATVMLPPGSLQLFLSLNFYSLFANTFDIIGNGIAKENFL